MGRMAGGYERLEEDEETNGGQQILLDPFNGGAILSEEDCARMVGEVYGQPLPLDLAFMHPVGPRQFLARMLNNLKASYVGLGDFARALRIEEFILVLHPKDSNELRDRGMFYSRTGQRWKAIYDFQIY
jgi:regulator of sirC expression with transglutaminase-like and TPR domain